MINRLVCKLIGHRLGKWEYIAPDCCDRVQICNRCGYQIKSFYPDHDFLDWKNEAPGKLSSICRRCGWQAEIYTQNSSDFEPLSPDEHSHSSVCCGEGDDHTEHTWVSTMELWQVGWITDKQFLSEGGCGRDICRFCGKIKE